MLRKFSTSLMRLETARSVPEGRGLHFTPLLFCPYICQTLNTMKLYPYTAGDPARVLQSGS